MMATVKSRLTSAKACRALSGSNQRL